MFYFAYVRLYFNRLRILGLSKRWWLDGEALSLSLLLILMYRVPLHFCNREAESWLQNFVLAKD